MRIIGFDDSEYPIISVRRWATGLAEQNDRLRNRIAINRVCRAMYRAARSEQHPVRVRQNLRERERDAEAGVPWWRGYF